MAAMIPNDDERGAGREPWREAVAQFARETRAALGDRLSRVVLFGSRARGDHEPDSDVDLIVFIREGEDVPAARETVRRIARGVAAAHDDAFLVMAFVYTEESFLRDATYFFIRNVKAEGVEV
jgi:predicted nucleotidyltransferase